jgi:predicted RNase H-like nuclease
LAGKNTMAHSKNTAQGFTERLSVLLKNDSQTRAIVEQALDQFRRKDLARDDILDALVLAVAARFSAGRPKTLPLKPSMDQKGLPMEIVYPPAQFI